MIIFICNKNKNLIIVRNKSLIPNADLSQFWIQFLSFSASFIFTYTFNKLSIELIFTGHCEAHTGALKGNWKLITLFKNQQHLLNLTTISSKFFFAYSVSIIH